MHHDAQCLLAVTPPHIAMALSCPVLIVIQKVSTKGGSQTGGKEGGAVTFFFPT